MIKTNKMVMTLPTNLLKVNWFKTPFTLSQVKGFLISEIKFHKVFLLKYEYLFCMMYIIITEQMF